MTSWLWLCMFSIRAVLHMGACNITTTVKTLCHIMCLGFMRPGNGGWFLNTSTTTIICYCPDLRCGTTSEIGDLVPNLRCELVNRLCLCWLLSGLPERTCSARSRAHLRDRSDGSSCRRLPRRDSLQARDAERCQEDLRQCSVGARARRR